MDRKQMVIKTGISLLCLAVLTACGGGGGSNFTKPESKFPGKEVRQDDKDKNKTPTKDDTDGKEVGITVEKDGTLSALNIPPSQVPFMNF
ncbi:hypothetical protein [Suttonella ornithocola]|uniref:Uncharacterized protein n=1 Tax=Suttonella ornithocola TaxID=279832 RepID=A0A380MQQ3_9GAMM|nr:hypothetical protein [Suttonella ornithocola]SUO94930.1 Uncharacterised protein [Suttonella ornithocola]